ncbi:RagB/SusD family nutrient uptake outer membrane protein [Sphingobacterium psychroaquaticum]|uniref:RagB/SusD family nutrient uptake outer membrane protein n=1 Tax=Sphingobacterium psychroaquaticum TaxID=561061 RepID=UPI001069A326|nr:RagB/SusD family nutrient uptake outer membrane protein [Sphingobacterium psychroaquaticum]QBQ42566.1 RagB/SusD family nutrient uptake outer membrane protein [Sphingobacterium psychroaquaticum]
MKCLKVIYVILLSVVLGACGDKLKLLPEQDLADEVVFNSVSTTESALRGIYSNVQKFEVYGSLPQVINDFMGNTVEFVGTFPTLQDLNNFSAVSTNGDVRDVWRYNYEVILQSNKLIAQVGGVPGITSEQINQFTGEAKFLRALIYLQLAGLYSQPFQINGGNNLSVPLVLDQFVGTVNFPSRSTLNEIHAAIEADLKDAIELLPVQYGSADETLGKATKGAAYALLSRLYLYRDQNDLAASNAKSAIDLGLYGLTTSVDVFTIMNSAIDNGRVGAGGWASYYNPASLRGRGDATFSEALIAMFEKEPEDKRFQAKISGIATDGISRYFPMKYPDAINNSDNSPVLRTAELYLNRAEGLAKASGGVNAEAVSLVNSIRAKAGLPNKNPTSQDELIELILVERTKELAFEGHSRIDLLRNKKNLRTDDVRANYGAPKTVLPIPQREIDTNVQLRGQQNPEY